MKFKGFDFRRSDTLVSLPNRDEQGNLYPHVKNGENYVYFGRITKDPSKAGAIKTTWKNTKTDEYVYAVPVEIKGHSLTNMAYGADNQVYLMKDGICYQASRKNIVTVTVDGVGHHSKM